MSVSTTAAIHLGHTTDGKPFLQDLAKTPHMITVAPTGSGRSIFLRHLIRQVRQRGFRLVTISPGPYEPATHEFASVVDTGVRNCALAIVTLALELLEEDEVFSPATPTILLIEDTDFLNATSDADAERADRVAMQMLIAHGAEKGIYIHAIRNSNRMSLDEELFDDRVVKNVLTRRSTADPLTPLPKSWSREEHTRLLIKNAVRPTVLHGVTDVGGALQAFELPCTDPVQWVKEMRAADF